MELPQPAAQGRLHNPSGQQGGTFGYEIAKDNFTTNMFDDFKLIDESGNEIPHA